MRQIITGLNADGKSTVLTVDEIVLDDRADVARQIIWQTDESPPLVPAGTSAGAHIRDTRLSPGGTRWIMVEFPPNLVIESHRTHTIDYDFIIGGEADFVLEAGSVHLVAGDCVFVPGVVHKWITGPKGIQMSIVVVGIDPT